MSDGSWRRCFNADPAVIGRAINFNGASWTVIGVLPANFDFYGRSNGNNDMFLPIIGTFGKESFVNDRASHPCAVIARLRAGRERPRSRNGNEHDRRAAGRAISGDEYGYDGRSSFPASRFRWRREQSVARDLGWRDSRSADRVRERSQPHPRPRIDPRTRDRRASGGWRLALANRSFVVERIAPHRFDRRRTRRVARFLGGCSVQGDRRSSVIARIDEIGVDVPVLIFSAGTIFLATVLFGLLPAWKAAHINVEPALKSGARGSGHGLARVRKTLIVSELHTCAHAFDRRFTAGEKLLETHGRQSRFRSDARANVSPAVARFEIR